MPKRSEKSAKFRRWCLYFPAKQDKGRVSQSLNALRALVNKGRAGVVYHEVSARRVDLEWPYPVGWDSATRLCSLALKACPTFRLLGEPHGIQSDEGADAQRAEETPETRGEEPPKRRRGAPKKEPPAASAETASAGAESAETASAGADSAGAASAGAASAVAASAGAAAAEPGGDSPAAPGLPEPSPAPPAVSVEPAPTAWSTWVAPTAVAVEPRLLGIKLEHLGARFIHGWFGGVQLRRLRRGLGRLPGRGRGFEGLRRALPSGGGGRGQNLQRWPPGRYRSNCRRGGGTFHRGRLPPQPRAASGRGSLCSAGLPDVVHPGRRPRVRAF